MRARVLVVVLIALAVIRMAATFRVLAQTADEQTHIGAGLELFQNRTYWLHRDNPPLPRVIMAVAPWLGGMRINLSEADYGRKLHSVIYDHGTYKRNLVLMRVGNLLFFIVGAWATWMWARREAGETEALVTLLLFTMQPIVLGYSALATHDGPATAGVAVALLAFSRWLEEPSTQPGVLFGVAYGFSILCKFSCIAFVPAACMASLIIRRRWHRSLLVAMPVAAVVVWAGYAFTLGRFADVVQMSTGFGPRVDAFIASHLSWPLPMPAFVWGIASLLRQNHDGWPSYFFGKQSRNGFLMYFPAAVALKTTLPFLALLIAGVVFSWRDPKRRLMIEALVAATLMIACAIPAKLDIGIRYILPAYVPLSLAAAIGAVAMMHAAKLAKKAAIALIVLHCGVSIAAHPDYFPFFNVLAWPDPSRYLIDSNLDWGQDVLRLRDQLRRRRIDDFGDSLMGGADLRLLHFPPSHPVNPWIADEGWLAVSDHSYRMQETEGGWKWLEARPYSRIGKSIRLYKLPPR